MAVAGPNRSAVAKTVTALKSLGRLNDVDRAVIVAAEQLASAIDANPRSPGLWKEYGSALERLAAVGKDEAHDGLDELLDRIGRTPLGDTKET